MGKRAGADLGSGVCAERRHKARRTAVGSDAGPADRRRTGEASVIVAADGLTASDAVSCQLNLEHIHNRQPGTRASLRGLSRANSRYGEPVSTRPDMGVGIGNGRSGPSGRSTSVATTGVRFPRPQYLRWAPLAAEPTRACYTDRTVMRAFPSQPVTSGGSQVGLAPTERRSALLGL